MSPIHWMITVFLTASVAMGANAGKTEPVTPISPAPETVPEEPVEEVFIYGTGGHAVGTPMGTGASTEATEPAEPPPPPEPTIPEGYAPRWTHSLGDGTFTVTPEMLTIDEEGNTYIAGTTHGDLAGDREGRDDTDAFVARINAEGELDWIEQFGTSGSDYAASVTTDTSGNVYVAGDTNGSLYGSNAGSYDGFLARENAGWGVRRIVGELKKLAVKISRSSIRRVLVEEKILPDPDRRAPAGMQTPWRKFIAIHMNVLVACDFFCKTLWTPLGRNTAYVLAFIHLGSRKVFVTPSTFNPTGEWMRQQARNVSLWAHEENIDIRFLIHDRDTKFTNAFDGYFRKVIKTPYLAPKANSFAESWIGHFKRECLNHFLCFGLGQLDHIVGSYADYYNRYRPHQGLGNRPLGSVSDPPGTEGAKPDLQTIRCRQWLGGLLKHYYRKAA